MIEKTSDLVGSACETCSEWLNIGGERTMHGWQVPGGRRRTKRSAECGRPAGWVSGLGDGMWMSPKCDLCIQFYRESARSVLNEDKCLAAAHAVSCEHVETNGVR